MSDTRTDQLLKASFRTAEFRVRSEMLVEGGRKIVLHEYVNSSERFVEDLGEIPPTFSIRAFVHGVDFLDQASKLENALRQEGPGKLVLPTLGTFTAFALPYSKDASQTSVGEITFRLEFAIGRPAPGPTTSKVDEKETYDKGDTARQKIEAALAGKWIIPTFSDDAVNAEFDIRAMIDQVSTSFRSIVPTVNSGTLLNKINSIDLNIPNLVRVPLSLASNLIGGTPANPGMWQEVSLGLTGGLGLDDIIALTSWGNGEVLGLSSTNGASLQNDPNFSLDPDNAIPLWQPTTRQRIDRNQNRLNLVNAQRVSALVGAYEVAADRTYQTEAEINAVRVELEDIHERIMREETSDIDVIQSDDDVRKAVEDVRLASLNVLEQKRQETYTITQIRLKTPSSAFVQSFNFYAEEFNDDVSLADRAIELRKLNPEDPANGLKNDIDIFRTK